MNEKHKKNQNRVTKKMRNRGLFVIACFFAFVVCIVYNMVNVQLVKQVMVFLVVNVQLVHQVIIL